MKPRLSVFKGREAKLNKAIFQVLAREGALTIYEICKKVRIHRPFKYTKYSVINRRVRNLVEAGYIEEADFRKTLAGFKAKLYQLTTRAYLAMIINHTDIDKFLKKTQKGNILTAIAAFTFTEK